MDSVVGELTLLPSLTLLPDSRAGTVYEHQNTDREEGPSWQASGPSGKTEGNLSACSGIQSVWPDLSQLLPSPCCLHSCVCVGVGGAQEDEAPGRRTWDGEPICSGRNLAFWRHSSQKPAGTSVGSMGWKKGRKEVMDSLGSLSTPSPRLASHP